MDAKINTLGWDIPGWDVIGRADALEMSQNTPDANYFRTQDDCEKVTYDADAYRNRPKDAKHKHINLHPSPFPFPRPFVSYTYFLRCYSIVPLWRKEILRRKKIYKKKRKLKRKVNANESSMPCFP